MEIINNKSLSFEQIRSDILDYLGSNVNANPNKWLDMFSSGAGMTIAELIAGLGSYISFAAMNSRREAFIESAKLESSLYSMANLRGLSVSRPEAPKLTIQFEKPIDCPSIIGTVNGAQLIAMHAHYTKDGVSVTNTYDCYLGRLESTDESYPDGILVTDPDGFYSMSISPEQDIGARKFYIDNDIRNITVSVTRDDKTYFMKLTTSPEDLLRDDDDKDHADIVVRTTVDGVNIIFGGASSAVYSDSVIDGLNFPIKSLYSDEAIMIAGSSERSLGLIITKDGETWTSTNIKEGRFTSVLKTGHTYYAASSDLNAIYTSLDAINWTISYKAGDHGFETFGHITRLEVPNKKPVIIVSSSNSGILYKFDDSDGWKTCSIKTLGQDGASFSNYSGSFGECLGIVAGKTLAIAMFQVHPFKIFYTGDGVTWLSLDLDSVFDSDTANWRYALPTKLEYVYDRFFITRPGMGLYEFKPGTESYKMPESNTEVDPEVLSGMARIVFTQTMYCEGSMSYNGDNKPSSGRENSKRSQQTVYGVGTFGNVIFSEELKEFVVASDIGVYVKSVNSTEWRRKTLQDSNDEKIGRGLEIHTANLSEVQKNVVYQGNVSAVVLTPSGIGGSVIELDSSGSKKDTDDDYGIQIESIVFRNASVPGETAAEIINSMYRSVTETSNSGNYQRIKFKLLPSGTDWTGYVKLNSITVKSGTGLSGASPRYWMYLWQRNNRDDESGLELIACSDTSVAWSGSETNAVWSFVSQGIVIPVDRQCGITFIEDTAGAGTPPEDFRDDASWTESSSVRISVRSKSGNYSNFPWSIDGGNNIIATMTVNADVVSDKVGVKAVVATADPTGMDDYFVDGDGSGTRPYSPTKADGSSNLGNFPIRIKSVSNPVVVNGDSAIFRFESEIAPVVMKDQTMVIYFIKVFSADEGKNLTKWSNAGYINTSCFSVDVGDLGVGWKGVYKPEGNTWGNSGPGYSGVSQKDVLPWMKIVGTRKYDRTHQFGSSSLVENAADILGRNELVPLESLYDGHGAVMCFGKNFSGSFVYADKSFGLYPSKFLSGYKYYGADQLSDDIIVWTAEEGVTFTNTSISNASSVLHIKGEKEDIGFPLLDGDKISITYLSSYGRTGISEVWPSDVVLDIDNKIVDLDYIDGGFKESVEKIRSLVPGYHSSYRRLVSQSDFVAHTLAARTDIFSANCYKCPFECCTAVVPYLRGYINADGFIVRTGDNVKANEAFNKYMEDRVYKYKMIGTEVTWQPAQETTLEPKIVVTIQRGTSESDLRESIRKIIVDMIYKVGGTFSVGGLADQISDFDGVIGVHVIKPNDDYRCTADEYLASSSDIVNGGIIFKYELTHLTVDDDNSSGYVNSVPRLPFSYNRISLDRGSYAEGVMSVGKNDIEIECGHDYDVEYLGATIMLKSDTSKVYIIAPSGSSKHLPQDDRSTYLPGLGSDGNQLRAKFVKLAADSRVKTFLRLYTNDTSIIDVGSAEYLVSISAVGAGGATRTSIAETVKIEVI